MSRNISMLNVMTKLPNSGLTLSDCKVVEDLAVQKLERFTKLLMQIIQN